MKKCYNCNQNISDVDVCPICGEEMKLLLEDNYENVEKDINIELDFTVDYCVKCDNLLLYNQRTCKKCGTEKEIFVNDIDPKVKVRKEKFQVITELINYKNAHIKNLRKNIHRGIENKVFYENFLDLVQPKISELNELSLKNLYKNISFKSEVIESIETKDKVKEIKKYIENIYEIYESLLIIDPPYAWKNIYNRLCSAVQKLLDSNKAIISSLVAETIENAFTNNKFAQDKLNEATEDILLVDNMFGIKNLELNFDLIKDGNINKSLAIIMMIGSRNDNEEFGITEQYNKMQVNGYNYFKDSLQYDLDYYMKLDNPVLLKLCSYRFMSIYSFSENDFAEKTKIVINALEKAKTKNFTELKSFIDKFESKYIYATKVLNQVFQDYVMYLSYCKDEKLLIRNAMKWYKDLSEGVYRDIVSLLIACGNILDKKELDYNNILEWLGFGDKFDYMNNKKKLRFDKLTEGVEKIIRHSEAHVDFEVDNYSQKVVLRNKISKEKLINEKTYTYEEFFLVQVKLQETIFSIVTGLEIFMINNYIDFKYFLADIEHEMKINEADEYESTFSLIGITNINKKEVIEDNKKILLINGTSIYRTDKELFSKCISCTAPIVKNRNDIDIIRIELEDIDSIEIGSVEVITKYIKESYSVIDKFRKYQLLLSLKTTKINYYYNEDTELKDNYGFKFIFAILQWFLELIKLLNGRKNNIDLLNEIRDELSYSVKVLQEYKLFSESNELLDYTCNLINYFIEGINTELQGILSMNVALKNRANLIYRDTCFKIASISGTQGEDKGIKKLLLTDFLNKNKIGRNDLCPCGSGKKYKKCCAKN